MFKYQPFYETFHKHSNFSRKIINKNDFVYKTTLKILEDYAKEAKKIIDIGCGVGSVDLYLGSMGKNVLGIDVSKKAVQIARKDSLYLNLEEKVRFQVSEFPKKLPKGKFDVVICSEVLEHINDDYLAVRAARELLKDNGFLIASSPSDNAPLYKLGLLNKFDKNVGHIRRYSEDSFKKLFEKSGFDVLKVEKTEGIIRNFLFTNSFGGFLIKFIKRYPLSGIVTFLDNITVPIFGESDLYLIARKK